MRYKGLFFGLCATAFCLTGFASDIITKPIQVTNVRFHQEKATKDVIVDYTLVTDGDPAFVLIDVLTNGVSIGMEKIRTADGDISIYCEKLIDAGNRRIVWHALSDWKGNLSTNASVEVQAYYSPDMLPYLMIDLDKGTNAVRYPVLRSPVGPDPHSFVAKTSQLWLRRIEPGTFLMGSAPNEPGYGSPCSPETRRTVTLTKAYYLGVFPVTQGQWSRIVGASPNQAQVGQSLDCSVSHISYNLIRGIDFDGAVSNDVLSTSFFGILRAKTGLEFDLPTEAQWEYAARAGTEGAWYNGTTVTNAIADANLNLLGWYKANCTVIQPVGQKIPNAWGLYDLLGNLWEWNLDYLDTRATIPDQEDPRNSYSGAGSFSMKGGCYLNDTNKCRIGAHNRNKPTYANSYYGFRIYLPIN
ncbi:MAG: formylglycine-generating enzyme family protein [Kiritimatiellae bacterium]|nr:formylglycine-generating enzyme family protein [Kiritimatiellia bacterium]